MYVSNNRCAASLWPETSGNCGETIMHWNSFCWVFWQEKLRNPGLNHVAFLQIEVTNARFFFCVWLRLVASQPRRDGTPGFTRRNLGLQCLFAHTRDGLHQMKLCFCVLRLKLLIFFPQTAWNLKMSPENNTKSGLVHVGGDCMRTFTFLNELLLLPGLGQQKHKISHGPDRKPLLNVRVVTQGKPVQLNFWCQFPFKWKVRTSFYRLWHEHQLNWLKNICYWAPPSTGACEWVFIWQKIGRCGPTAALVQHWGSLSWRKTDKETGSQPEAVFLRKPYNRRRLMAASAKTKNHQNNAPSVSRIPAVFSRPAQFCGVGTQNRSLRSVEWKRTQEFRLVSLLEEKRSRRPQNTRSSIAANWLLLRARFLITIANFHLCSWITPNQ